MDAYLERINPADNCLRFYRFELFQNLFGDWQLDRGWGRIGQDGAVASTIHVGPADALNCAHAILALKVSRGYEVRSLTWDQSNIAGLAPRTERGVLNLTLCAYFSGHRVFQEMALRMYRHNIIYMGEFVQLPSEDISLFLPKHGKRTADYFDELTVKMDELSALLGECNLTLGCKMSGWTRPDGEASLPLLVGQSFRRCRRSVTVRPMAVIYRPKFGTGEKSDERGARLLG